MTFTHLPTWNVVYFFFMYNISTIVTGHFAQLWPLIHVMNILLIFITQHCPIYQTRFDIRCIIPGWWLDSIKVCCKGRTPGAHTTVTWQRLLQRGHRCMIFISSVFSHFFEAYKRKIMLLFIWAIWTTIIVRIVRIQFARLISMNRIIKGLWYMTQNK